MAFSHYLSDKHSFDEFKMLLNKCCCCVDLRTGAIVLAVLGIINSFCLLSSGGFGWEGIILLILGLSTYGCLLFGAIKNNRTATLISVVMEMIYIVWMVIVLILLITLGRAAAVGTKSDSTVDAAIAVCVVSVGLQVYFWICIYSFYQALKEGSYNPA